MHVLIVIEQHAQGNLKVFLNTISCCLFSESKVASALPRNVGGVREAPAPDMTAIHKALFLAGKRPAPTTSSRPQFTVTMAKNGSRY